MNRWLRVTLIVFVVLALAVVGARWYLTSSFLAARIAAQLETTLGARVKVTGADVWFDVSSVEGLELIEEGGEDSWLTARLVETDLSLFDFLKGNHLPGNVNLRGAHLVLRFDEEGNLLTRLPDKLFHGGGPNNQVPVPKIDLQDCEITLRKGKGALVLKHLQARLEKHGADLRLSGSITSTGWGLWNLKGTFGRETSRLDLELSSRGTVRVTQAMLEAIPFIPPSIWEAVKIIEGATPAVVKVGYDLKNHKAHYRVELEPVGTRVQVAAIELDAADAQGKVVIEDGLVLLRGVKGNVFQGVLRTDADLDFRTEPSRLEFHNVEVHAGEGLDVALFPKSWKFPPKITGTLVGSASLQVLLLKNEKDPTRTRIHTNGHGKGRLEDAKVAGFPAENLSFSLVPEEGGYRFAPGTEKTLAPNNDGDSMLALLIGMSVLVPPAEIGPSASLGDLASLLSFVAQEKEKEPAPKKTGKSSTFDIDLSMKDLDLTKFAKELNFKLPFEMAGRVSFQVKVSIPLDDSGDLKKYRLNGMAQLRDFELGGLKLDSLDTEVVFNDGLLRMPTLKGRLPADPIMKDSKPGSFEGTGSLQVEPWGDLKVDLKVENLPLSQLAWLGGSAEPVQGDVTGTLTAQADARDLTNFNNWKGSARLSSQRVFALGWNLVDTSAALTLDKNELVLSEFQAKLEGAPITATARLGLGEPFAFTGKILLQDADLSAMQRLAPQWRPPVTITGKLRTEVSLKGTASPLKYTASGETTASALKIDTFALKDARVTWELDPDRLTVAKLEAALYEGQILGAGVVPLRPEIAGSLDLTVQGLDAGGLSKAIPGMPMLVQGLIDGEFKGTLSPVGADKERPITVHVDLRAPKMRVQPPGTKISLPTEELKGFLEYKKGDLDFKLQGKFLGSPFELVPQRGGDKKSSKAHFHIENVSLGRLLETFGVPEATRFYQGTLSLRMDLSLPFTPDWPQGSGRLRLANVRYKDLGVGGEVVGDFLVTKQHIRLRDLSTTFGEGQLRAQAAINLRRFDMSWFNISLDRVEAARLFGPWLGDTVQGPINARVRGRLGSEWSGTVDLQMTSGVFGGLDVSQVRMPMTFRYVPREGRGQVEVPDFSAQSGPGRVSGKFSLAWEYTVRLEGQLRFFRLSVENLLKQAGGPSRLAGGMMTGRFDFAGLEMRSLEDLSGNLDASFEQSKALEVPVLKQISPFLGVSPSTTFQKGEIRARLTRGTLHIHALALEGPNLTLFIEGTVSLTGRLNLQVRATTANFGLDPRLRFLATRIPLAGPVPLVVANEVTELISNRVILLHVTGTFRVPSIRLQPLATVTQGAIRYFLSRTVGPLPFTP